MKRAEENPTNTVHIPTAAGVLYPCSSFPSNQSPKERELRVVEGWAGNLILFLAGVVAGTLNVIAGGGSFLTLPLLIFLGLPASVANGTNRVGILIQNISAVHSFASKGVLDQGALRWAALPSAAGALLGSVLASQMEDQFFERILAVLMVAISLLSLWSPRHRMGGGHRRSAFLVVLVFFAVGIYGGFVQAGVGFFILAATTWTGLDLVRGNAVKVLTVLVFTLLALIVFAWQGKVVWLTGIVLGAGTAIGGRLGANLTVSKGTDWIRRVVTATIIVFALKLWFD